MDHMMPGMDGVDAMKRLRANAAKQGRELCVVALTANAISSSKEMFLSEGFDAFLPKPIELMELERVLKHVLPRSAVVYESSAAPKKPAEEKKAPPVPAEPKDLIELLAENGVDTAEGLNYCQNELDFYKEILAEFAKNSAEKLAELKGFLKEGDLANYAIRVHSVKSTAKTIGADEVSEEARQLELAAKAGDGTFVAENHAEFAKKYGSLMSLINGGGTDNAAAAQPAPEADGGEEDEILEFAPGGGL